MKILYFNQALKGTILSFAGLENPNYPATNLKSTVLKKVYRSINEFSLLTVTGIPVSTINSFYIGWTNCDHLDVTLYRPGLPTVVKSINLERPAGPIDYRVTTNGLALGLYAEPQYNVFGAVHFENVTGVASFTMEVSTDDPTELFIGGIGFGNSITLKDPTAAWVNTFDDNSSISETLDGQSSQSYLRPLKQYSFEFAGLTYQEKEEMVTNYLNTGLGALVWADFFERNRAYCKPGYFRIAGFSVEKKSRYFNVKMSFKEAR